MSAKLETSALNLLASSSGGADLAESGFAPKLLCAAVSQLLANFGIHEAIVEHKHTRSIDFETWAASNLHCLFLTSVVRAKKGCAYVAFPHSLFEQVFVAYYGGYDPDTSKLEAFTPTQIRFAERLASKLSSAVSTSWLEAPLANFESDKIALNEVDLRRPDPQIHFTAIEIVVTLKRSESFTISVAISSDLIAARAGANPYARASSQGQKGDWADKLMRQAGSVKLPVRAILARPEIPAARLLALKCGDVIPIVMPSIVPVTVGGRLFAHARMGEQKGSVAICIENIGKGDSL
jgi:flagellar motor switch protein FliM